MEESVFLCFFFLSLGFSSRLVDPRTSPNDNSRIEVDDQEDFHRLKDMSVPKQKELIIEQALYDAGLSSISCLGIV